MAQASKRRPWAVEMKPAALDRWLEVDAFRSQEIAEAHVAMARKGIGALWKRRRFTAIRLPPARSQPRVSAGYATRRCRNIGRFSNSGSLPHTNTEAYTNEPNNGASCLANTNTKRRSVPTT